MKKVVFAIDALEYDLVEKFNCKNLKQEFFGKTDISEFEKPRTMVLWSSFITGMNKEKEVLKDGKFEMWNKKWNINETFFKKYRNPKIIDLPGFSYDLKAHENSRKLLKKFFEAKTGDDLKVREECNEDAFKHHRKVKKEFLESLDEDYDFVLGYFSLIDIIGHLNFGSHALMKMIYKEFDELAGILRKKGFKLFILSDHGMKEVNYFGYHSEYGFWSSNFSVNLNKPKITEIHKSL